MSLAKGSVRNGMLAGLLAGTVLVVLFYFYDLGRGEALRTPAYLLGALLDRELSPTVGVIAVYTVLHYLVWALLGVLAVALIRCGVPPNPLIGAAYGLFACSVLFYGGLIITGPEGVLRAPAWPAVFFGNALAGLTIFATLHAASSEPGITGFLSFLEAHPVTRHGLVAGLLGAVVVATWFLVIDTLLRDPLFTPAALGTVLFRGGGPANVAITPGTVFGYSLVHFAAFVLFGMMLSGLTEGVERHPPLIFGLLILFVVFEVFFVALVAILGRWVLQALAWWSVMVGNLLAAAAMGTYMWKVHPALSGRLKSSVLWAEE
ncbi:MAG: hypothetical protein ACE5HP_09610 [Gemmatimonadota bacterium]